MGSIPGWGTKLPHANEAKKKKKKVLDYFQVLTCYLYLILKLTSEVGVILILHAG